MKAIPNGSLFLRLFADLPAYAEPLRKVSVKNSKKAVISSETSTLQINTEEVAPKLTVTPEFSETPLLVNSQKADVGPTGTFLPKGA